MIGNARAFGLALVGMVALFVVGAPAASAEPVFHSEESHTIFTGQNTSTLEFTGNVGTVKCESATLEGTASSSTVEELELEAAIGECTAAGLAISIDFNGCFPIPKPTLFYLDVYIKCPTGKQIEITGTGCTIDIPTQNVTKISWFGATKPWKIIKMLWELSKIKYKQTGAFCAGGSGEFENGTLTVEMELEGENTSGEPTDIWIE